MNLESFADDLHQRLTAAAATGTPEIQQAAERLAVALEPAIQLGLLAALSEAAAEINAELTDGTTVEVRLAGRSPNFVVTPAPDVVTGPVVTPDEPDDATVARISLRLPEALKTRAEERANRAGQSLNSWLVAAVRAAADGTTRGPSGRSSKRIQGWVR